MSDDPFAQAVLALDEHIIEATDDGRIDLSTGDYVPVPRQLPDAADVFREEPAPVGVFIKDKKFMRGPTLSEVQFRTIALGSCIFYPATYTLDVFKSKRFDYMREDWFWHGYTELVLQLGKGSGKDMMARYIVAYGVHLLECLKNPHDYYGIDPDDSIDCLNMARSAYQANHVFFKPLSRSIQRSPWFSDKADIKDGVINFEHDITATSGHAGSESLEGLNIIIGVADEIASFKTPQEMSTRLTPRQGMLDADGAVQMMKSSGQSRFPGIAKVLGLSFPRFRNDYIQQWYAKALLEERLPKELRTMYGLKKPTWEVNPRITRASLEPEFRKDPEKAKALYACDPPHAENPYFRNVRVIDPSFQDTRSPVDDLGYLIPGVRFDHRKPCAGHLDLAFSKDRCALCFAHVQDWVSHTNPNGKPLLLPIIFVDVLTSFHKDELGVPEIDLPDVEFFILDLMARGMDIRKCTADQFQSKMMLQSLGNRGIETEHLSVDRDTAAYDMLKWVMRDGRLVAYSRPRVQEELKSLQIINGIKIDHPPGGSKDEADALAGAVANAVELGMHRLENTVDSSNEDWSNVASDFHPDPARRAPAPSRYAAFRQGV